MPRPIHREKFPVAKAVVNIHRRKRTWQSLVGWLDEIDFYTRTTEKLRKINDG